MLSFHTTSDTLMVIGVAAVAGLVTFCVRALPRLGRVYWGTDTWFHLKMADVMRQQGRVPDHVDAFLVGGVYDYPPALPRLLSFLPRVFVERYQWAFSPLADALQNALIFVFASWLWGSTLAGVVASLVFASTPIACSQSGELTPRCAGVLFVSIALASAILYGWFGQWVWGVCAVVFVAATLLTHRMSTQTLVWVSASLSLALGHAHYLLILLSGFLLGSFASRGLYSRVLRGHLAELGFWHRNLRNRDDVDPLKLLLGPRDPAPPQPTWRRLAVGAYSVVRHQPYIVLALAVYSLQGTVVNAMAPLAYWVGFAYAAFLLTGWIPSLRFLGHNYRYLCYASLPIAVIGGGLATTFGAAPWLLGGVFAASSAVALREYAGAWRSIRRNEGVTMDDAFGETLVFIAGLPGDGVVCLPMGRANAVAYFTGKRVVRHCSSQAMHRLVGYYPLVTRPLEEVAGEFDCAYILLDERFARGVSPVFTLARRILHRGPYHLLEVEPSAPGSRATSGSGVASVAGAPAAGVGISPASVLGAAPSQPSSSRQDRGLS